jgi:hypothetical protein
MRLNADERAALERWPRRPKAAQAVALRAHLVLVLRTGQVQYPGRTGPGYHATDRGQMAWAFREMGRLPDEKIAAVKHWTTSDKYTAADARSWLPLMSLSDGT